MTRNNDKAPPIDGEEDLFELLFASEDEVELPSDPLERWEYIEAARRRGRIDRRTP